MSDDFPNSGLAGLLEWAGPVIYDRLCFAYEARLTDRFAAMSLARTHARVWRALLSSEMATFESLRMELAFQLVQHGLTLDHLAEADYETMNELLEIVIARFRGSPKISRNYHLALMQLAAHIAPPAQAA